MNTNSTTPYGIVIHGGAGTIQQPDPQLEARILGALQQMIVDAENALKSGASALDVVDLAVCALEDNPLFNAGKGAVYTNQGKHELDAAIMNGANLAVGAVAGIRYSPNPIRLARTVMDNSEHVFLGGLGAEQFARDQGLPQVENDYFDTPERYAQYLQAKDSQHLSLENGDVAGTVAEAKSNSAQTDPKFGNPKTGTVGAVALDLAGNLAAATSTGGITNKLYGRIGDSPVIGAGTYANNASCAVSATGHGERFIQKMVAYDIHARLFYQHKSLQQAADEVVFEQLPQIDGSGGIIAIDRHGNIALPFNTTGMYRGFATHILSATAAIFKS